MKPHPPLTSTFDICPLYQKRACYKSAGALSRRVILFKTISFRSWCTIVSHTQNGFVSHKWVWIARCFVSLQFARFRIFEDYSSGTDDNQLAHAIHPLHQRCETVQRWACGLFFPLCAVSLPPAYSSFVALKQVEEKGNILWILTRHIRIAIPLES